ncbi:EAL domain-containing protein [Ferrimonas gelatinilytica]|uniref:EAL domain-containing protein n=1 Tax=Ferrimonas gelatinilytica TaxID=1255257 RepID=A0ABP9SB74_9GAMM
MTKRFWGAWVGLWALLLSLSVEASAYRLFGVQEGLENQTVWSLAEDGSGLLWVGTEDGLYRLGDRISRRVDRQNGQRLLDNSLIQALLPLSGQRLLISTSTSLVIYHVDENRMVPLAQRFPELGAGADTRDFYQSADGDVWFATEDGRLYRLASDLSSLTQVGLLPNEGRWRQVWWDPDGDLWVLGQYQLWKVNITTGALVESHWDSATGTLYRMQASDSGGLWIASSRGLFQLDLATQKLTASPILEEEVWDIQRDPTGALWLLGRGKLWRWHSGDREPQLQSTPWGGRFRTASADQMLVDSRQRIWLGSRNEGVLGFRPLAPFVRELYQQSLWPQMGSETVWHLYADEDERYMATTGGVQWFHPKSGRHGQISLPGLTQTGEAWSLLPQGTHTLLVGTTRGLYQIDRRTHRAEPLNPGGLADFDKRIVYAMVSDGDGIWLLTDTFTYLWQPNGDRLTRLEMEGQPVLGARNVQRDRQGRLWIGGEDLLGYWDRQGQFHSILAGLPEASRQHTISMILPISEDQVLFGSFGRGLWQYSDRSGEMTELGKHWGLQCDNPNFGTLWQQQQLLLGCDRYLYRIDLRRNVTIGLDQFDGLAVSRFNEGALFNAPGLGVFIGSVRGAVLLAPDQFTATKSTEQALIESVTVHYDGGERELILQPEAGNIPVRADYHMVSLQFASNRLLDPTPKAFEYRLSREGHRGERLPLPHHGNLIFSRLPPGHYGLELFGTRQGLKDPLSTQVQFTVEAYWWQLASVRWGGSVLLLLLLWAIVRRWQRREATSRAALEALDQSQRELELALAASGANTWHWRSSDNRLLARDGQRLFGPDAEEAELALGHLQIHPADHQAVRRAWLSHINGESDRYEARYRQADFSGQWRWIWAFGQAVSRDPSSGKALTMAGLYKDITHSRQIEQEHSLFAQAFEHAAEGALILDPDWQVQVCNPAAVSLLQTTASALIGVPFEQFWDSKSKITPSELQQRDTPWQGEILLRSAEGETLSLFLNISTMITEGQRYSVLMFADISERKRAERDLARLANFDPLTGLANRTHFSRHLGEVLEHNRLLGQTAALMFLDLDRFKQINDTYGHGAGDSLLVEAARRLQALQGTRRGLCRFGGDEFLVLVSCYEQRAELVALAQRILDSLSQPFEVNGHVFYLSTSVGIACWPGDAKQPETLIKHADLAMYRAKEKGRGQYCFYVSRQSDEAGNLLQMDYQLRQAMQQNRLEMYYQPIADTGSRKVVGFEALLRCFEPGTESTPIDRFIDLAESNGFIITLDRWALQRACEEFSRWSLGREVVLSVNVSAAHFHQSDLVSFIDGVLRRTGLAPRQLCLEITERVLMRQMGLARRQLQALRRLGVQVAIDDFGTGYSSLAYLSQLEVDHLKIDRSFTKVMTEDETHAAIVRTIIGLGQNLGMTVVAEGVENNAQLAFLKEQGCQRVQGFLLARPMSAEACYQWLHSPVTPAREALASAWSD